MSAKDTLVGTTKRLVAEIVGDGVLAEEGARQNNGNAQPVAYDDGTSDLRYQRSEETTASQAPSPAPTEHERFALLLGHAALNVWADLPREAQERLFAAAVDDGIIANSLAVFLHDRHPKTSHPPKPTQTA
jgi:hypothetical protein